MRLILLSFAFTLALATTCYAKDISGYFTPEYKWILGTSVEDLNLDDFAEIGEDDFDWKLYLDLAESIQFNGVDTKVAVILIVAYDELVGVSFLIPEDEKTYSSIRKYYVDRYSSNDSIINEPQQKTWTDNDMDFLTVIAPRAYEESSSDSTLVMYMTRYCFEQFTGIEIPYYMYRILEG